MFHHELSFAVIGVSGAQCPYQHNHCAQDWSRKLPQNKVCLNQMSHQFRILGNNWNWKKDLWVDPTYIVHSSTLRINNPNQEALPSDHNWLFLSLRRHISHHFTFSSHLSDTTSYHLQSLSVKPHFCCPEASDSLPARTQKCVKIKGDFCHYPIWTPRYTDGEARFFPGKIHLHRMSRTAWNPITTAGKKGMKK